MTRIGLVSCSAEKLDHVAPARELYTSQLFKLALRYAEQSCTHVYILSGLHHLVPLDEPLGPYDFNLNEQPRARRLAWGRQVMQQLRDRHPARSFEQASTQTLVVLAGAAYANALQVAGSASLWQWSYPLDGMQIGERLRFLSNATKEGTQTNG